MYGDLLLDQLGVNFLGPAPLDLELLHMLTTFHWNALGSTLGWCPPPPLQSPGVARDGLPGGGGRRSPSDGVPGGGGEIARVSQGKLGCVGCAGVWGCRDMGVTSGDSGDLGDSTATASSLDS